MTYKKHVFFCTNQKDGGRKCCAQAGAADLRAYARQRMKDLDLDKPGGIRINTAGCLGHCAIGPALVIYPEGVWYTYHSQADIDRIIEEHLLSDMLVKELQIDKVIA